MSINAPEKLDPCRSRSPLALSALPGSIARAGLPGLTWQAVAFSAGGAAGRKLPEDLLCLSLLTRRRSAARALMSYGTSRSDAMRVVVSYTGRILKGEKLSFALAACFDPFLVNARDQKAVTGHERLLLGG